MVDCLGILNGAQLFSLSKDEMRAVCGDEGSRVFSQISVQKAQIEVSQTTLMLNVHLYMHNYKKGVLFFTSEESR